MHDGRLLHLGGVGMNATMTAQVLTNQPTTTVSTNRLSDETSYYRFGLKLGLWNLAHNHLRLGLSKTLGKILQPINSYTRFPEYAFMGREIERYLAAHAGQRLTVLDVSSPKCFGLNLAYKHELEIHLTDIDVASVDESEILWQSIRRRAKGRAEFSVEDARALRQSNERYDIVFAMSVIEHVANTKDGQGDSTAIREMLRVLKPGGLLLVSVPFGPVYTEQERIGLEGAAVETKDQVRHFFQRIYTPATAEEFLLEPAAPAAELVKATTVGRRTNVLAKLYRKLGANLRGLCGCLNPFLSLELNEIHSGIVPIKGSYGSLWSSKDVYGDLMLAWEKRR